jgi:hypothetical protein
MYSILCALKKTPPLPDQVEKEFLAHAGDDVNAWSTEHGIDAAPIGKLIQYAMVLNPKTGRYRFVISDRVAERQPVLAVPIYDDGKFIDLLLIGDDMSFETACCKATWLGRITPTTRLHSHPMDWIESGCTGVCHIEPISRTALKDLQAATTIECNDIHTALEAWDWGFGADDDALARFSIDDTPGSISAYYEDDFKWRTASKEARYGS